MPSEFCILYMQINRIIYSSLCNRILHLIIEYIKCMNWQLYNNCQTDVSCLIELKNSAAKELKYLYTLEL